MFDESGVPKSAFRAGDTKYSFSTVGEDEHWKLCNGQALDKTAFSALFSAIGSAFDTMPNADGTAVSAPGGNLFRVPRCGARFPLTTGSLAIGGAVGVGATGGEEKHVLTEAEMPAHTHGISASTETLDIDAVSSRVLYGEHDTLTNLFTQTKLTTSTGGGQSHNTLPPYFGVYTLICTGK